MMIRNFEAAIAERAAKGITGPAEIFDSRIGAVVEELVKYRGNYNELNVTFNEKLAEFKVM